VAAGTWCSQAVRTRSAVGKAPLPVHSRRGGGRGQADGELAAAGDVGHADGAAVGVDQATGDGQPEASSLGRASRVAPPQLVEDAGGGRSVSGMPPQVSLTRRMALPSPSATATSRRPPRGCAGCR
jgi:hypothetical protein